MVVNLDFFAIIGYQKYPKHLRDFVINILNNFEYYFLGSSSVRLLMIDI